MTLDWSGPDFLLMASAAAMGLAGSWHCALMCGPLCAAIPRVAPQPSAPLVTAQASAGFTSVALRRSISLSAQQVAMLVGRLLGYAAGGAALAAAASWGGGVILGAGGQGGSLGFTLWALAHAAALSLGLCLVVTGRQPRWWTGRARAGEGSPAVLRWVHRVPSTSSWGLAGFAWVLLPCGLLQSALVLATLASGGAAGAAVMVAFALSSAPGLLAAPALIHRIARGQGDGRLKVRLARLSGALLVLASAWTLGHGLWVQVRDYC